MAIRKRENESRTGIFDARLRRPLTHAAAAAIGGDVFVLGGRSDSLSGQRPGVTGIDPATGATWRAGRFPFAVSDLGATAVGGHIVALGGRDPGGTVHDEIWSLRPR